MSWHIHYSVAVVNVSGVDTVVQEDSGNVRGSGVVPSSPGDGEGTSGAALSRSGYCSERKRCGVKCEYRDGGG